MQSEAKSFNSLHTGTFFMIFCCLLIFISKLTFAKNSYRKTISVHPCINQLGCRSVDEPETEKLSADDKRCPPSIQSLQAG